MKIFTFCLISSFLSFEALAEISFKSGALNKLHQTIKDVKPVPLLNIEICTLKLDKEVLNSELPEIKGDDEEIVQKLKDVVSQKENVDERYVHSLSELFNYTHFKNLDGVVDNTFCFTNLPQVDLGNNLDRNNVMNLMNSLDGQVKLVVLFDDGFNAGIGISKLYLYAIDLMTQEAYAIKSNSNTL